MRFSAFFDYPTLQEAATSEELVLLTGWSEAQWGHLLTYTETRRFSAGDVVIREGDVESAIYVVTQGTLEVIVSPGSRDRRRVEVVEPVSLIGEVGFFDGKPRSATVEAVTDGELLRLSFEAFEAFSGHEPELARELLLDLGRILSVRLRRAQDFFSV